ncbi:MAG: prolipoprotein diacylglyceryl transferase [Acidobacteriia bacterium]|nr:prolipoprotein diacylglyceryl transferase [Terriglobia bacterium]
MFPFIHLGPVTLGTYGLMVAVALISAFFILRADFARRRVSADAEAIIGITGLAGLAGSRLYHLLESPAEFFADPWPQLFSTMGFAFFGAVIGGFLALLLLARRFKIPALLMLDVASPAAALGYGIGRIGCLLSGDGDYGIPTSLPWGMSFPNGIVPTTDRVHPTPIYEFLVAILIFWILWKLGERGLKSRAPNGMIFAAYLVLTGIARFLVEIIRINPRSFYGLSNAQAASVVSVIAGTLLFVACRRAPSAPRRA